MVEMAVARSAGWTTSTTTAATGPLAAVIVAPPVMTRRNWTTPGPTAANAVTSRMALTIASAARPWILFRAENQLELHVLGE
jgi:hypothetical protein